MHTTTWWSLRPMHVRCNYQHGQSFPYPIDPRASSASRKRLSPRWRTLRIGKAENVRQYRMGVNPSDTLVPETYSPGSSTGFREIWRYASLLDFPEPADCSRHACIALVCIG